MSGDTMLMIGFAILSTCLIISLLYGLGFFDQ